MGMYKNGGLTLFGDSILCNSTNTWSIGSTWCRHIDGYCQMADNIIRHPGGIIANIWRLIPPDGITACNLRLRITCPRHVMDNAKGNGHDSYGKET